MTTIIPPVRRCTQCGEEKPATVEFFYPFRNKIGLTAACRVCTALNQLAYRQENREIVRQQGRQHYARNRDAINAKAHDDYFADVEASREASRQRNTKWRNNNRKRYHEIQLKYRQTHPQRVKDNRKSWYYRNLEHARLTKRVEQARRRAEKLAAGGSFTKEDIMLAYRSQRGKCWHCGKHVGNDFHEDHLIPLRRGGTNWPNNIVVSCAPCNLSKGKKLTQEWNGRLF